MRNLIDITRSLFEDEEPAKPDEELDLPQDYAKELFPPELKKRKNFELFLDKILSGSPFIDNMTGAEVYIDPSEAKRIKNLFDTDQFKGEAFTVMTTDGDPILLGSLRKTTEFGGSSKENLLLKPSLIKITERDILASDLFQEIDNNPVLSSTLYGQEVQRLAAYIEMGERCMLSPEFTKKKDKTSEAERKAIVDYAGEYLGVLALVNDRSRFPRKDKFKEWLGADLKSLIINFPKEANNNIADSYANIRNGDTNHRLNISSKGTGGGAAPAVSGLKISDALRRNTKLKTAVQLLDLCADKDRETGPSTIVQAFKVMDLIFNSNPTSIPKQWHKYLPFGTKTPKLQQMCVDSIAHGTPLPSAYQSLIGKVNSKSDKVTDGGKLVYLIKKTISWAVNENNAVPEFAATVLQVLEMNFIQQYTDYNPTGEITFATQWPATLEGVVTLENKSSAVEPSSAGFSFKLGRTAADYLVPGPDDVAVDDDGSEEAPMSEPEAEKDFASGAEEIATGRKARPEAPSSEPVAGVGRTKRR
jgi:hypothetical protein